MRNLVVQHCVRFDVIIEYSVWCELLVFKNLINYYYINLYYVKINIKYVLPNWL